MPEEPSRPILGEHSATFAKMADCLSVNLSYLQDALVLAGNDAFPEKEVLGLAREIRRGMDLEGMDRCRDQSTRNAFACSLLERVRALVDRFQVVYDQWALREVPEHWERVK